MKKAKLQIGIVGLGKFGFVLGQFLTELGHEVVALDDDPEHVRRAKDVMTQVYQGDGTDPSVLSQLGFSDFAHVVVSVGERMEASILICLHLKELGVQDIWAKAVSWEHEKVLRKIGVNEVFFPERYAARQMAQRITVPGLIEYLPFAQGVLVQKLTVDEWGGQTLRDLNLTNRFRVQVLAVRKREEKDYIYLPQADQMVDKGDELVVMLQEEMIPKIKP